jgi:hypothetical protein
MSDGERAIFYLIGSILCAHENAWIIVDEPEINLHKSIIIPLWDKLENIRSDCKFIYLTHDFEFALSRNRSKKIWLKEYIDENLFDYELLEDHNPLPADLYLKVLGSAKSVVFIEGNFDSIDYKIYSVLFPNITLQPCGNCGQVINNTKAFRKKFDLHHIYSYGIIDRDRRNEKHIKSLKDAVSVLSVAESENILLTEIVLKLILKNKGLPSNNFSKIKDIIIERFKDEVEQQCFDQTKFLIKKMFEQSIKGTKRNEYINNIEKFKEELNVIKEMEEIAQQFQEYILNKDYDSIICIYNCKGLLADQQVLRLLGFKSEDEYINSTREFLSKNNEEEGNKLKVYLNIDKIG